MRFPLACLLVLVLLCPARAAEPFFKKNDVIALVGGEDMVVAAEDGYLELLLVRALPDYHLRFRSLAWEGDTVFEQNRELNFPSLEDSLDKVGATVVICQFGQMESLAGKEKIPEFIAAYEKLLERFSGGGKRRLLVLPPNYFNIGSPFTPEAHARYKKTEWLDSKNGSVQAYAVAVEELAKKVGGRFLDPGSFSVDDVLVQRDGAHFNSTGQQIMANIVVSHLDLPVHPPTRDLSANALLEKIEAKNLLWFNYWRVQNWAFLAGDRTNQPSSRDWKDPSKRWFPAEREEFLPLIDAKEKEIDAFAEKLK